MEGARTHTHIHTHAHMQISGFLFQARPKLKTQKCIIHNYTKRMAQSTDFSSKHLNLLYTIVDILYIIYVIYNIICNIID